MLPSNTDDIRSECQPMTPARILDSISEHRRIAAEALQRIDTEGTVVRTLKGDVIAHPAIKIHADAVKAESALLKTWASSWQ